jgi:hypothetical protein
MNPTLNASVKERPLSRIVELNNLQAQLGLSRKEVDRLNEQALKDSIKFEQTKNELHDTKQTVVMLVTHLCEFLEDFENLFDYKVMFEKKDKPFTSEAMAEKYIEAATFMEKNFKRTNHRVEEVTEWMQNN